LTLVLLFTENFMHLKRRVRSFFLFFSVDEGHLRIILRQVKPNPRKLRARKPDFAEVPPHQFLTPPLVFH
jgi:hypothetical protein